MVYFVYILFICLSNVVFIFIFDFLFFIIFKLFYCYTGGLEFSLNNLKSPPIIVDLGSLKFDTFYWPD